jgi:tRNA (guanine37-N1)-methyltransferase
MVLCIKVRRKDAEGIRRKLEAVDVLDINYIPKRDEKFVYFAVKKRLKNFTFAEKKLEKKEKKYHSIKEYLEEILSKKEMDKLIASFDVIGSVAILEIPNELEKKEKEIAKALMLVHGNVKTVLKKVGARTGVYRLRKLKVIAGDRNTETTYKENDCIFKLDVAKVYFSPRLGFERRRIASLVRPNETILAFFAGVGPFPIVIAKFQPKTKIYAIELNPHAFHYLKENIRLNNMDGAITPIKGDVRKIVPRKFKNFADRILMPLPKGGEGFLKYSFIAARKNCVVHFYSFASAKHPFEEKIKKIEGVANDSGRKIEVVGKRIVRPYSPGVVQVVIDFKVNLMSGKSRTL